MGIIFTILMVCLLFKVCGWMLKLCGKILGAALSLVGYLIVGVIAFAGFGLAIIVIPIVLIVGIATVIGLIAKVC